jgi:pSer/pThr/pTyr-binding forkhead associated (FHA) protein
VRERPTVPQRPQRARLTARLGTKVIAEGIAAPGVPLTLGSAAQSDLAVNDVTVSRRHLEVEVSVEGVRVKDLASTNGTRLHGRRIAEEVVPFSSVLLLGDVELCIEPAEAKNHLTLGELESVSPPMIEAMKALSRRPARC